MPCGDWESVCKLYNVRRSDLSQRTASSLTYLLKRAQRSSLQILQCARRLVLKSIEEIGSLQLFLQQKQALHDLSMLEFLSQHAPVCKQLAKVADAKVIDILLVLPGKLGSELWLQGMYEQFEIEGQVQLWRHSQQQVKGPLTMAQVWDQDLQPFKNQRFALSLDNSPLVVALQHLVQEATKTNCRPTAAAAAHERQLKATFFSRTVAFNLVQQLPEATCAMPLIQTVPLVQLASPLQTLEAFHYDPAHLHLLPSHLQHLYTSGRLAGVKAPQRSRFWPMDFANTSALRRAPGASPGIYQIFLCRYETDSKGQRKLISRTEWYNGAASIALAGRIADYLPLSRCGHPGPRGEITKLCLFWAACEHGFEFELRFLKLDGMTPAEVYQVEAYYLQYKWPLNKQQNWGIRISPPLTVPSRLAMPTNQELVQTRIDNYPCNSLHAQGLAQLGTSVAAAAEAETELYEGLDDQSDCESTFDSDWEQESSGDDGSEDEHSS